MRLFFLLPVLVVAAACSATPPGEPSPTSMTVASAHQLASVEVVGGLCPAGPCRENITVKPDGSWRREKTGHDDQAGVLGSDDLNDLVESINKSSISAISAPATCAALNSDGRVIVYSLSAGDGFRQTSTCEAGFSETDPAVVALEKLRETLQ